MKSALPLAALLASCGQPPPPPANEAATPASPAMPAKPPATAFVAEEENDLIEFHYGWSAEAAAVVRLRFFAGLTVAEVPRWLILHVADLVLYLGFVPAAATAIVVLLGCSLYVAFFQADYMVMLGGLAVSYAFQLYPALLMICYAFRGWPTRWTPQAVIAGLVAGIVGVTVTYYWPAYRYPLSIHSAGWGILINLLVIWIVSPLTRPSQRFLDMQQEIDRFFRTHDPEFYTPRARWWQNFLWFYAPFWWLMFVGPGIELGNYFDGVLFGAPGLWLWLILGGATGTWLLYVMCFPAQMATAPRTTPEPIDEEARLTITEV